MIKKAANYALAYVMWFITLLLGLWFIFISIEDFQGIFSAFYIRRSSTRASQVGFYMIIYLIVVGLLWILLIVITEQHFRSGAKQGGLLRQFANIAGPEFLIIFFADLVLSWLQGSGGYNWFHWLLPSVELIIGVGLLTYAIWPKYSIHSS